MTEHKTYYESIEHLTEAGEGKWECWCHDTCCFRPQAPGDLPICVCPDCACQDYEPPPR